MNRLYLLLIFFIASVSKSGAQVKIGAAGTPNTNAVLELDGGTNKGLLLPRLNGSQITALTTAPDGLFIYNITDGFVYLRKAGSWQKISDATTGGGGLVLPYTGTAATTAGNPAFRIQNTSAGSGISGEALGAGYGVFGYGNTNAGGYFSSVSGPALMTGTGSVGIGTPITSPPSFPLDVNGRIRIRKGTDTPGLWFEKLATPLEQSSFFGVLNDSIIGIYGAKNNQWKFFFNHDNNNFGIYNSNPRSPLSFQALVGSKIDFFYQSPTAMYGIGVQSAELQLYTNDNTAHTSIGYGSSTAFTETFRVNAGSSVTVNPFGIIPGTTAANYLKQGASYTGAIKTILQGVLNGGGARLGFYTGSSTDMNALAERLSISNAGNVGIGNTAPVNPLSFPATLEKKISFYPGATGDVGIAVSGNELRIYSDNSNAVTTIGYDDFTNGFTENFRVAPSGISELTNPATNAVNVQTASYFKTGNTYNGAIKTIGTGSASARMGLYTYATPSAANLKEAVSILDGGNVGINTIVPNSRLQVEGSVSMPIKLITANYTATDNDYSIRYTPPGNASAQLTLPAAAGRTGRMYVISIDCGYTSGVSFPTLYVRDNNGVNVIANNAAYYDGTTAANGALEFNALMYVQFNNSESNFPVKRKVSITVQSDGSRWVIIDGDFKN